MKMNFTADTGYIFYETEIKQALDWLFKIRDNENNGWAWVQFIKPNEQNTAEVICAFAENEAWLKQNEDKIDELTDSINYWLLDTSHAKISIDYCWVLLALQKVRNCKLLAEKLNSENVERAINNCLNWLIDNYTESTTHGIGWGDNSSEISNVIRTSLAVIALNREIKYLSQIKHESTVLAKIKELASKSCEWLSSIQNKDGGWGNLASKLITQEYQRTHSFSFQDLKYQCDSNAASTGYVMLALNSYEKNIYDVQIKNAFNYLKDSQMDNGGWSVFTEIGVRDGERYTFRHFGTAWALQGIIDSECGDYRDECVIHGFEYLSELQDKNYGGWRSSPDADNYTWATCNALMTIKMLKHDLAEVHAKHFLNVVWDWWTLKKKDANFNFKLGKITFAFNGSMALMFCITFSIMITLMLALSIENLEPVMALQGEALRKLIYSLITVFDALLLGLPWIVYVKNQFRQQVDGWINAIGWVYGIITGFVLVLYQFII